VAAALVAACGIASAATKDQKPAQPTPTVRIPESSLGYVAPSETYLHLRYALTTVDFIDNDHLLFTYHVNRLMQRIPNDDASDNDQTIHAEVLDIASGKVMQQADWRMHDRGRYLWALNGGQFLVRVRNSMFLTDSRLVLHPYLSFDTAVQAIELSPDRKLMLIELEKILPPESSGESNAATAASPAFPVNAGGPAVRQKRTELDDGFIETAEGKLPHEWALKKTYFDSGKPKEFAMVRSACTPKLQALSETVVLALHCSAMRTAGNPLASAVSTEGGTLWTNEWQDKYIWPSFGYATDGSRFVYEALEMEHSMGELDDFAEEDVRDQPAGVFDTESGKLELVVNASPVLSGGSNFALSADGRRFAILRNGAIEVYDLPPVPVNVKKSEKK
jgi:hypothetical protein